MLVGFLVFMLKFYISNKFVSIWIIVLNDAIERLQMGVSAILQSCIGKYQLMALRTFFMHFIRH